MKDYRSYMFNNITYSLFWLDSSPQFNVAASLSLRDAITYPSGRHVPGSYEQYCVVYDDFIKRCSERLLGASHALGESMLLPNEVGFGKSHEGNPMFRVQLALPEFFPLKEEMRLVGNLWGESEWSDPCTELECEGGHYDLRDAFCYMDSPFRP